MHGSRSLPSGLLTLSLAGAAAALTGAYLDDAWHTSRGRDSFFIAPHVAIYGGVTLIGAVLALWTARRSAAGGLRAVRRDPQLLLAVIALAGTLVSAPIDNAWHVAFGRDAVLWSPPHLLGIIGTMTLGAALLMQARPGPGRLVCGGLVLAAANFVVAEYETDVPQFSEALYLPVLAVAAVVACTLVRLASPDERWAASRAAAVHLGFVAAIALLLRLLGFPAPSVPIVLAGALALDVTRGRTIAEQAVAMAMGLLAGYAIRRALGSEVLLDGGELLIGAVVAAVAAALLLGGPTRRTRAGLSTGTAVLLLLVLPVVALAHDPGQGEPAGTARLDMRADGHVIAVRGRLTPCRDLLDGRVVARRAGRTVTGPLDVGGCRFSGSARVDGNGRWFVYVDVGSRSGRVETWLPLEVGAGTRRVTSRRRFAYVPDREQATGVKRAAAAVLYLVVVALLVATVAVAARSARGEVPSAPA